MNDTLSEVEARIVGCLIEKQITTPDYYPLSLNALTNACNQKNNRDPVVFYDDRTVEAALHALFPMRLVIKVTGADSRVPKYRHQFPEIYAVTPAEVAVLCVLMLRGPLTLGEVRGCTGRLHEFADLAQVEATLDALMRREPKPYVMRLPRQPGQKESRFAQLLCGEPEIAAVDEIAPAASESPRASTARHAGSPGAVDSKLAAMEGEIAALRAEIDALKREFESFRKAFE
ncbi:MAG: YceH family protein [bacterium]